MALADLLEPYESELAAALRLCASGNRRCNRRTCPRCSRARTARLASRYKVRLAKMLAPCHLTLTNYPAQDLTKLAIKEVRDRFRLLRRRIKTEKKITVLGGVANIEIDATDDGRWLIGLHAVIDAPLPPSENWIRKAWQALGGGRQVRLDQIVMGTQGTVFAYSTKITTLPATLPMLLQFVTATKGLRAVQPFGSLHPRSGRALRSQKLPPAPGFHTFSVPGDKSLPPAPGFMMPTVTTSPQAATQDAVDGAEVRS